MDLMTLVAKFTADTTQFESGMKQAQNAMNQGKATAEKLESTLGKLKTAFAGVVTVAGIQKISGAIKGLADNAASAADRIDKNSQALGMSRKAYQQWDYILGQSGASIDNLGVSMKTLNSSLLNPSDGTITALNTLGVNLEQIQGLSQEEAFEMMVRQFQKLPEGATKSALAMQMFGKQGQALMPLLNSAEDSIDTLRGDMERLGFEMSDSMVEAGVKYGDTMDNLKKTLGGISNILGYSLMESFTGIAEEMTKFFSNEDVQDAVKRLAVNLHNMGAVVLSGVQSFFQFLTEHSDDIATVAGNVAEFVGDIAKIALPALAAYFAIKTFMNPMSLLVAAIAAIAANWPTIKEFFTTKLPEWTGEQLEKVRDKFNEIGEKVAAAKEAITTFFTTGELPEGMPTWLSAPITAVQDAWDWITDAVDTAKAGINSFFNGEGLENVVLPEWVSTVLGGIRDAWDWITDAADTVKATISGFFNGEGLENIVLPEWVTTVLGAIQEAWDWITDAVDTVKSSIDTFFAEVKPSLPPWLQTVLTPIETAWNAITTAVETVQTRVSTFFTTAFSDPPWRGIVDGIISVFNNVKDAIQGAIDKLSEWFGVSYSDDDDWSQYNPTDPTSHYHAAGKDYVPSNGYKAVLHEGEAVLNKRDAEEWRRGGNRGATASEIAEAVFAVFEGMSVVMDGATVGRLTAKTVGREMEREARAGRFVTA